MISFNTFNSFLFMICMFSLHDVVNAACDQALGMEIESMTASSNKDIVDQAHLHISGRWRPSNGNKNNIFLQGNFRTPFIVTAIATQGLVRSDKQTTNSYVRSYQISASDNGQTWTVVKNSMNQLDFTGNIDGTNLVIQEFYTQVVLTYFRITITDWEDRCHFQFELYGCTPPTTLPSTTSPLTSSTNDVIDTTMDEAMDKILTTNLKTTATTSPLTSTSKVQIETIMTTSMASASTSTAAGFTTPPMTSTANVERTTLPTVKVQTTNEGNPTATGEMITLVELPQAHSGSSSGTIAGAVIGILIFLIIILVGALIIIRKRKSLSKTNPPGMQYDGPYDLTIEGQILPGNTPEPATYQNTPNVILSEENNTEYTYVANHNGEVYAEIPDNEKDKQKISRNKTGMVEIYATSQYGGTSPYAIITDEKTDNENNDSPVYTIVDRNSVIDESGNSCLEGEGWKENEIYGLDNENGANEDNGWNENEIYGLDDENTAKDDSGWKANSIYTSADTDDNGEGNSYDKKGSQDNASHADNGHVSKENDMTGQYSENEYETTDDAIYAKVDNEDDIDDDEWAKDEIYSKGD